MNRIIDLAQKRFTELCEILKRADDVRQEWQDLKTFLQDAERVQQRLDPANSVPTLLPVVEMPPVRKTEIIRRMKKSAELAEYVIRNHGPHLHVNQVLDLMRAKGWLGSGNDLKDYKNIHQLLASNSKRFKKVRKGVFECVEKTKPGRSKVTAN